MSQSTNTRPGYARVELYGSSKTPALTEGSLAPDVAREMENACNDWLEFKEVPADKLKAGRLLSFFKDPNHREWISAQRETLKELSVKDFFLQLRTRFLEKHWARDIQLGILRSTQRREQTFNDWSNYIRSRNGLLRNTPEHLSEQQLRDHFTAHMTPSLRQKCDSVQNLLIAIEDFEPWINEIISIDKGLQLELKRVREAFDDFARASKKPKTSTPSGTDSAQSCNSTVSGFTTSSNKTTGARLYPPALTPAERTLLFQNNGCLKCRRYNQDHQAKNCPNGPPSATSYQPLKPPTVNASIPAVVAAVTVPTPSAQDNITVTAGEDSDESFIDN